MIPADSNVVEQAVCKARMGIKKMAHKSARIILSLVLVLLLGGSAGAATLFPNRARAWNKVPAITIAGSEADPRVVLVREAVDFWNQQLAEIGSGFRLGSVTLANETIPAAELAARSTAVLNREGVLDPPAALAKINGDLIVALSDGNFVSFTGPFLSDGRRLVAIRGYHLPPLTLPNVARNVIAHELGHAIGLGHNDDPNNLMCGRPASCRPDAFRSNVEHYFPLMEEEKQFLLRLYPPTWK
jgi:hypothetical protein